MDGLLIDFKYALRGFFKRPGFYAAIVVTLALGIGANTAIFTLANTLLLRPLPYPDPERLVHVWQTVERDVLERREFSYPDFLDVEAQATSFVGLAAYQERSVVVNDGGLRSGTVRSRDPGLLRGARRHASRRAHLLHRCRGGGNPGNPWLRFVAKRPRRR